jgi:predicted transcriptional regulator
VIELTGKVVRVIHKPQIIKVLTDPVRREILRLLRYEPRTQTQLARELNLSKPSMKHHIQLLFQSRLIKIAYTQAESHGIIQKYFEPTSSLFIEDFEKTPANLQKYFLQLHIERLRGMLSVFQLIGKKRGDPITVTPNELKDLAHEIAKQLTRVAKKYENMTESLNRETLLVTIYSEALNIVMNESKWKPFFNVFFSVDNKILKVS